MGIVAKKWEIVGIFSQIRGEYWSIQREFAENRHRFTAFVADSATSDRLLDALSTLTPLTLHYGHYLPKTSTCRQCGSRWITHEEKMTDVNIAAQLLCDAYDDHFDTALILSGDSDLNTPVKIILTRFPDKKVIVVFPPRSLSDLGVRREGKRDRDQNLCKFEANSGLFNEDLRKFWPGLG